MEALAVLRLSVSPRRHNGGHGYLEDDDEIALPTPYTSAPSSPRRAFAKAEVEESPLGEVRAAVPFVWELVPGKPRNDLEGGPAELSVSSDETEESRCRDHGSSSSRGGSETTESTLSRNSSNTEFEFSSRFVGVVEPLPCRAAEELFSNGQLLPLRLPPRLQAVKHLRNSDSSCSDSVSSSGSFQSYHSPQSQPRIAGSPKRSVSLCGFSKSVEETATWGMQERKLQRPRPFSPLRLFNRESSPPVSHLSLESVFSASSSSSSSETHADLSQDSPDEENARGSTLKDLLFTDMAMASMRIEGSKMVAKPRQVQSRLELLRKQQEQWNGFADAEKVDVATPALTPPLSRSNARSRPLIDVQDKSSQKANVGRAIFANRFGMLCRCMGMALPESP